MRFVQGVGIPVEPAGCHRHTAVAGGLIHDWASAVFVPAATADQLLAKLEDYKEYGNFYKQSVIESRLLARDGNNCRFSMRWAKRVTVVTNVIDADYESSYFWQRLDRWWPVSRSTQVQEIERLGGADEWWQPIGVGSAYIWRLYSIMRVMVVDRGVLMELEAIALSLDILAQSHGLVNPIVSRNGLQTTLSQTRQAVT
jgi:hypothetical protein